MIVEITREEKLDALEELLETIKRMPYRQGRLNPCQTYLLLLYKREITLITGENLKVKRKKKTKK